MEKFREKHSLDDMTLISSLMNVGGIIKKEQKKCF